MRTVLFALFILAIAGMASRLVGPAQAQDYPWCAVLNLGDASYNCGFVSRDQCMATVNGIGGSCQPNTLYGGAVAPRPLRTHRH